MSSDEHVDPDMDVEDIDDIDDLDMDPMPNLFWNLPITPGKEATIEDPGDGFLVRITNACFGPQVQKDSRTVVICKSEDKEVPICVLREGSYENHQLDLLFSEAASFVLKGNKPSAVTLTGYLQTGMHGGPDLGPESYMDDEELEDLDDEVIEEIQKKKRGRISLPQESESPPPSKKQKMNKQKKSQAEPKQKGEESKEEKEQTKESEEEGKTETPKAESSNDQSKDKKKQMVNLKNGIQYRDMKVGDGEQIKHGQTVSVYYVGQKSDGSVFDKNLSGAGFKFQFGKGEAKPWDLALKGAKIGTKRKIIIPAKFFTNMSKNNTLPNLPTKEDLTYTIEIRQAE